MHPSDALSLLGLEKVAHLATTTPDGDPHIVPITFALLGETVVTMIDHKPKTTVRLQRLVNIEHHPRASVLADHYSDDWSELWWVRIDGRARVHQDGETWARARDTLSAKYPQYRHRPPQGPAIAVSIEKVTSWASTS